MTTKTFEERLRDVRQPLTAYEQLVDERAEHAKTRATLATERLSHFLDNQRHDRFRVGTILVLCASFVSNCWMLWVVLR